MPSRSTLDVKQTNISAKLPKLGIHSHHAQVNF
jgi:hypothetical protein